MKEIKTVDAMKNENASKAKRIFRRFNENTLLKNKFCNEFKEIERLKIMISKFQCEFSRNNQIFKL